MRSHKPDEYLTVIKVNHCNQPVCMAFDVEDNPVADGNCCFSSFGELQ
jgi:hypothetical protein